MVYSQKLYKMKENYKIKVCVDRYNHVAYVVPIKVPRVILSTYFLESSNLPRNKTSTYELDQGPTDKAVGDETVRGIRKLLDEDQLNDLVDVEIYVDDVIARFPNRSDIFKTGKIVERLKSQDWAVNNRVYSDFEYFTRPGKLLGNYRYEIYNKIVSSEPPLLGERQVWMEKVMSMLIEWWYGKKRRQKYT